MEVERDRAPFAAATVPRDEPFSKTSIVVPDSAVPVSVNDAGVVAPSAGNVMTGAAGAVASTNTAGVEDASEVPPLAVALAV